MNQQLYKSGRLQEIASNIKFSLDQQLKSDFSSANLDPALVLLSDAIFGRLKLKCDILEGFVDEIANALKLHNSTSTMEDISLFLSRFMLHKLGRIPMPCLRQISSVEELTSRSYLDKQALYDTISYASARSCYGKNQVEDKDFLTHIHAALSASMLGSMYSYNLDLALRLLRTMRYVSFHRTRSFAQAFNFLLSQQSHNGRFGFFAPEVLQISKGNPQYNSQEEIYLPITVSAMWTIAETIDPRFILFDSV